MVDKPEGGRGSKDPAKRLFQAKAHFYIDGNYPLHQ
jgi:hypothetical protein